MGENSKTDRSTQRFGAMPVSLRAIPTAALTPFEDFRIGSWKQLLMNSRTKVASGAHGEVYIVKAKCDNGEATDFRFADKIQRAPTRNTTSKEYKRWVYRINREVNMMQTFTSS